MDAFGASAAQPVSNHDRIDLWTFLFDLVDKTLEFATQFIGFVVKALRQPLQPHDVREILCESFDLVFENCAVDNCDRCRFRLHLTDLQLTDPGPRN